MYLVKKGDLPIILAQPHGGIEVPEEIFNRLNDQGKALADTDWHINRLYDGLLSGVTVISAQFHRYVIDANRSPDDQSLYPGQNTTGLCPITDFDGNRIYQPNAEPCGDEIQDRIKTYHRPYHQAIKQQIDRLKQQHGWVILYDCHSIRSQIPYLFSGTLPDLNIGTFEGTSCHQMVTTTTADLCKQAKHYKTILNGRFKGGWTTRHYGAPEDGVHAIQMELAQSTYMLEQAPWDYAKQNADRLRVLLRRILTTLASLRLDNI